MRPVFAIAAGLMLVLAACGSSPEPSSTFTGSECTYDGPTEFELNSVVTFAFINTSDGTSAGYSIWKVPEGVTTDDITEHSIFGVGTTMDSDMKASALPSSPGIDRELEVTLDTPGSWAVNCFTIDASGAPVDYPAAVVEVSNS